MSAHSALNRMKRETGRSGPARFRPMMFAGIIRKDFIRKAKCFIDPENPGSKKHEFRQAGTGVPARAPE